MPKATTRRRSLRPGGVAERISAPLRRILPLR